LPHSCRTRCKTVKDTSEGGAVPGLGRGKVDFAAAETAPPKKTWKLTFSSFLFGGTLELSRPFRTENFSPKKRKYKKTFLIASSRSKKEVDLE
jgi:hypothetical protein